MRRKFSRLILVVSGFLILTPLFQNCGPGFHSSYGMPSSLAGRDATGVKESAVVTKDDLIESPPFSDTGEKSYLYGDVILTESQLIELKILPAPVDPTAVRSQYEKTTTSDFLTSRWPGGVVQLRFDSQSGFSSTEQATLVANIKEACRRWSEVANVSCVDYSTPLEPYVWVTQAMVSLPTFSNRVYCSGGYYPAEPRSCATLGFSSPGLIAIHKQRLSDLRNITHELGHTFGLVHEHQRPDRNNYLILRPDIQLSGAGDYETSSLAIYEDRFDFGSIMNYRLVGTRDLEYLAKTPRYDFAIKNLYYSEGFRANNASFIDSRRRVNYPGYPSPADASILRKAYGPPATVRASCFRNGTEIPHGTVIGVYTTTQAVNGNYCPDEPRLCSNGSFVGGSIGYDTCSAKCMINGKILNYGEGGELYSQQSTTGGETCASRRIGYCEPPYMGKSITIAGYSSCVESAPMNCKFNGQSIPHGQSVTAYASLTVPYGQTCASQSRVCSNGALSGSYSNSSCSISQVLPSGSAACQFNGQSIPYGQSVTAYASLTVPYGQSCTSQSRVCSNGVLSGSYLYSSCAVLQAQQLCPTGAQFKWAIQNKAAMNTGYTPASFCEATIKTSVAVGSRLKIDSTSQYGSLNILCQLSGSTPIWVSENDATCGGMSYNSNTKSNYFYSINGTSSAALNYSVSGKRPVWRSFNLQKGDHLFSLDHAEGPSAGYTDEGVAFTVVTIPGDDGSGLGPAPAGLIRMVRCANPTTLKHAARPSVCLPEEVTEGGLGYIFATYNDATRFIGLKLNGETATNLYSCDYPLANGQYKNFVTIFSLTCGSPFINKRVIGYTQ